MKLAYSSNGKAWNDKNTNIEIMTQPYLYADEQVAIIAGNGMLYTNYSSDLLNNANWKQTSMKNSIKAVVQHNQEFWYMASDLSFYSMNNENKFINIPLPSASRGNFINLVGTGMQDNGSTYLMCFQNGYYIMENGGSPTWQSFSFGAIIGIEYINGYFFIFTDLNPISIFYTKNPSSYSWTRININKYDYPIYFTSSKDSCYALHPDTGEDKYIIKIPCGETITVTYK